MARKTRFTRSYLLGIFFVIAVSTICQIFFSSPGYTPSDDGFILSGARRILWGEVPHRDFITIRPLLPYLIHAPIVYFGGNYTYWLSRFFVLLEFSTIAWFFVITAEKILYPSYSGLSRLAGSKRIRGVYTESNLSYRSINTAFSPRKKILFGLFAFIYGVYDFPFMAWYSIDAVLLTVLGLYISLENSISKKYTGYFLIGLSPLARQNFLLAGPLLLLLLGDYKKWRYWFAYFLPLILMGLYLWLSGALPDALVQLTAHTEIIKTGFTSYFLNKGLLRGILYGVFGVYFFLAKAKPDVLKKYPNGQILVGTLIFFVGLFYAAYSMLRLDTYGSGPFLLFGMVLGISLYLLFEVPQQWLFVRLGAVFITIAWSVSISLGHNTPGLASGGLIVFILAFMTTTAKDKQKLLSRRLQVLALCIFLVPLSVIFVYIRRNQIYEEQPARYLTYRLDGIYPGGNYIRTNERTYTYLFDLQQAIQKVNGKEFAILPDMPGYWAAASQKNPLPIDWPNKGELYTKPLMDRVVSVLKAKRGSMAVILQKHEAAHLASSYTPVDYNSTPILQYVIHKFKKTDETHFFEIYE